MNRLEIDNVSFSFKHQEIFKNVSLKVESETIVGITGPNGVGKSVLFKIIAGLIKPQHGKILFNGQQLSPEDFPNDLGALIENPGFIDRLSGFENLDILSSINNKIGKTEVLATLKKVGLFDDRNKKVKYYSLGMKKKLGIAQAIMEKPSLIILDEPTNALDEESVDNVRMLLREITTEYKAAIIIASHSKEDIQAVCDSVYKVENNGLSNVSM